MAHAQEATADTLSWDKFYGELPEVIVSGERPIAKMERGKLVFDMGLLQEQLPAENAYELLTRIPGVREKDGSLMVGEQALRLIINGRVTTLSGEDIIERLKAMPAERVKNAELMMSAPAMYNIRGAALNIVTAANEGQESLTGQLQGAGQIDKYAFGNIKGALFYSNKWFSLDALYSFGDGKRYNEVEHRAVQPLTSGPEEYYDCTKNKTHNITHNYSVDADYAFNEEHHLSLTYTGQWSSVHNHNSSSVGDTFTQSSITKRYLNNVDLQYSTPFGMKLGASFMDYRNPRDVSLVGTIDSQDKSNTSESKQNISKWLFTASENHTLPHSWEINYGAKLQLTHQNSWQDTYSADGEKIADGSDEVDYTERIFSAYVGFSKSWGEKLSLEASAEVENFHTPIINNWRVYPTLNLLYKASSDHSFNLSFSSNSEFPDYWTMVNSVYYSTTYTEIWGNPDLKPMHQYDINLVWRFKQRYVFTIFAELTQDFFMQLPYQPSDRMAVIMKYMNWNFAHEVGFRASASFNVKDRFTGNASATLVYSNDKCNDFYDIPFDRHNIAVILQANLAYTLWKQQNLRVIVTPLFQSPAQMGVEDIKSLFMMNATLSWASQNKHWAASLTCVNITNAAIKSVDTWGNQNYRLWVRQQWRTFQVTLTYKFGNYQERQHKTVDTSRMGH